MVVKIYGSDEAREYKIGLMLKNILESDVRLGPKSKDNEIHIIVSPNCHGESPRQEIDLVVIGKCDNYSVRTEIPSSILDPNNNENTLQKHTVNVKNFMLTIEVKEVSQNAIILKGTNVYVKRTDHDEPVTQQSRGQWSALSKYLKKRKIEVPWITNLIFLPKIPENSLPFDTSDMNILFKDLTVEKFFQTIFRQQRRPFVGERGIYYTSNFSHNWKLILDELTKEIGETNLDRERVDRICENHVNYQKYNAKLGKKLLIFRGYGGTGKTYILLNLAHSIYEKEKKRILILTYNNGLISDIRRLLAIRRVPDGYGEGIQIRSIYSFWREILLTLKPDEEYDMKKHREYVSIIKDILYDAEKEKDTVSKLGPLMRSWNYIMIDEGQDWLDDERDALFKLFTYKKIIVADGINQLIRQSSPCNWDQVTVKKELIYLDDEQKLIEPLEKSLRQKANITRFISEVYRSFGLELRIDENDIFPDGGEISIIEGPYPRNVHDIIIARNHEGKNENVDLLFVVPPSNVKIDLQGEKNSLLGRQLTEWGYQIFDGVNDDMRRGEYPTEVEQLRIFQYDSCRGLEGWISVNICFDEFFTYKWDSYKNEGSQTLPKSDKQRREEYISNWLLIPLTRAIHALVIHLNDINHPLSQKLLEIYNRCEDISIEWWKYENGTWGRRLREGNK